MVNGQTVAPDQTVIVNGETVVGGSGYAVVAGSTVASPATPSNVVVAGQTFSLAPASPTPAAGIAINGAKLLPGETTTINGAEVSVGTGFAVIGGSTVFTPSKPSTALVNGQTFSIASAGGSSDTGSASIISVDPSVTITATPGLPIVVAGQTLQAGGAALTASGHVFSQSGTQLVIDGTRTLDLPTSSSQAAETISVDPSLSITATPGQPLVIAGQTILPGGTALTVSGHVFSQSGTQLVIDGTRTVDLPTAATQAATTISVDPSFSITATPGQPVVIAGQTILPGGPAVTASGHVFSEVSTQLIIDGTRTIDLPTATSGYSAFTATATIDGKMFFIVEDPSGQQAVVDGVTVFIGGWTRVIDGQMVTAFPGGVLIGSSRITGETSTLALIHGTPFTIVEYPSGQDALVDGIAVSVGGQAVVIDGQTVSAFAGGVDVGGTLITLVSASGQLPTPALDNLAVSTTAPASTGLQPAGGAANTDAATTKSSAVKTPCISGWALSINSVLLALWAT